ncbi:MAG: DUF5041 domain-containing protein [Bacteroidetes bacterium]|nr:DUF5041 domain-containing protein [Bacteroidota bacterium]MBU1114137.1 DUF5041 domain-containing protein [Bacteroidota bacterium]MBU1796803.1 DUF5041 domain-containing protein [Bacteroidota bacterium]
MDKLFFKIVFLVLFLSNLILGQGYVDYENIDKNDVLDALSFSGINIFNFQIDSTTENYDFYIIAEEYAGRDNLIKTDTLMGEGSFKISNEKINEIRFITMITNSSYAKVKLQISTPSVLTWKELEMEKEYVRKHYWVKFVKSDTKDNRKIPLLFFGSEWDAIINGQKTTRFCSLNEVPVDLSGDAISEMPHFYVLSYLLK